nr:MAG TPA: hypothetical protein [Caudoviricetes sp.]
MLYAVGWKNNVPLIMCRRSLLLFSYCTLCPA